MAEPPGADPPRAAQDASRAVPHPRRVGKVGVYERPGWIRAHWPRILFSLLFAVLSGVIWLFVYYKLIRHGR